MVLKREIAEKHPWVVVNLFKGFQDANAIMARRRIEQARYYLETGLISREAGAALAEPVVKYGIAANRKVIEKYIEYAYDLGYVPRRAQVEEAFAPSTWGL